MFCYKCGEAIPDDSKICPKCGTELWKENNSQPAAGNEPEGFLEPEEPREPVTPAPHSEAKKPFPKKIIWIAAGVIVVILAAFLFVSNGQKAKLAKDLEKEWMDTDGTILKILEFDDGKLEYRIETGYSWLDSTLFTSDYTIVSGNQIQIKEYSDKKFTIEFNDEKNVMTISPAITKAEFSENWYYIEH
jgi:hypothetical protein